MSNNYLLSASSVSSGLFNSSTPSSTNLPSLIISKAYFNCHTDITIPYDELGAITVIRHDGSTCDIIRDGRFVLEGVEELNKPLDTLDAESK